MKLTRGLLLCLIRRFLFGVGRATVFPPKPEYALRSTRWQDTDASLNQVAIFLSNSYAEMEQSGSSAPVLDATFDTNTPGIDCFLVDDSGGVDGDGSWQAHAVDQPWHWKLREGLNTLRVRSVNTGGVRGAVSWVQVAHHA